ncbi:MAG: cbb3-type cytochrome c oxidase subunit II [Limisphaerales bacterium]
MNYGPLVFLAAFFALAGSWFGLVLTPQAQLGRLERTNSVPSGATYPDGRPGLARQGLDVYRANGCACCHSQQVGQMGTVCNVVLNELGTNPPVVLTALLSTKPGISESEARDLTTGLPKTILGGAPLAEANELSKALNTAGAKSQVWIVPVGPDIARHWGLRRSVAEDFLYDDPVMLGSQRIGPDLANVGVRWPDSNWHLLHLYAPQAMVKGSTMPPYPYLFETRKIDRFPSPNSLTLPPELAPQPGYEVVPTPQAEALAAYLVSLRADVPLFNAPVTVALPPAAAGTNAPAGAGADTNAAPSNPSVK